MRRICGRDRGKCHVSKAGGFCGGNSPSVNAGKKDAIDSIKRLTGGRGADYVFVTVGSVDAIDQGFRMSGPRGMTVIVGLPSFGEKLSLLPFDFIRGERILTGSFMGSVRLREEIPKLAALYKAGILKLDELISGKYPMDRINEAIENVEEGKALRNIIMF